MNNTPSPSPSPSVPFSPSTGKEGQGSAFELYCAIQRRLMRRFIMQGGTASEWCDRLAPAFYRRWGWILEKEVSRSSRASVLVSVEKSSRTRSR